MRRELARAARSATATRYAAPVALDPGYCTLSMLFSDWSHTGQRDLRVSNDRHYYLDGEEQLWRIAAGQPPTPYTAADGWQPLQIWGMGIASQDLTGDGRPEVFLTSQADNKLQTLAAGAAGPDYQRHRADAASVTAQRPYVGGDVLPSTAWHPEFADVNNDGLSDLLVTKGNVDAQTRPGDPRSERPVHRQPRRLVRRSGASRRGSSTTSAPAARRSSTSTSTACSTWSSSTGGPTSRCGATSGAGTRARPSRWATGSTCGCSSRRRTSMPSARGSTCGPATRTTTREVTVGGGHVSGELGWLHSGLGSADHAEVRVRVARRHGRAVDDGARPASG